MPGKTAAPHEIPYAEQGDKPPSIEAATKPMAERVHERLDDIAPSQLATAGAGDEGKLLIVQNTGDAVFKALSGDVTINAAGVAEIGAGKVGTTELADKGVTTAKVNDKAITLGKLADALGLTEGYYADGSVTSRKAKLTAGRKQATGNLTLTAAYQDVPGASIEITPAVDSILQVTVVFWFSVSSGEAVGTLKVDSDTEELVVAHQGVGVGTAAQVYSYALSPTPHTVKLRAKRSEGSGSCFAAGTCLLYTLIAA